MLQSVGGLQMFRALRYHDYRWLWISGIGEFAGVSIQAFSLAWLVLEISGGSFAHLGFMTFLRGLGMMVFLPLGGVAADRFDRRILLGGSYLLMGATFAIVATLIMLDLIQLWHAYAASFITGTVRAFNSPARYALVRDLVPERNVMNAVALIFVVETMALMVGAPIAGGIIDLASTGAAFYLVGFCFLLATFSLFMIQREPRRSEFGRVAMGRDLLEGIKYVASSRPVRAVIILGLALAFIGSPHNHMLPAFGKEVLELGPATASLLPMATGIGALTGNVALAALGDVRRKNILWLWLILVFITSLALFAVTPWFGIALVLLFLVGLGEMTFVSMGVALLQLLTPREFIGRIMSIWGYAGSLMYLGSLPMGIVGEMIGLRMTLLGAASICIALFIALGVASPSIRQIAFKESRRVVP
jgi:MFS family permease